MVIADDHAPFRATCCRLLETRYQIVTVVSSAEGAFQAVSDHDPDVLVLDLGLPAYPALKAMRELRARGARVRVVVLTLQHEGALCRRAFAAGAAAYVTKARLARDLVPAVEAARTGSQFCSPRS